MEPLVKVLTPHTYTNLPVQKNDFHVHVLSVFMQKVFQEMGHGLVGYVTADHNVPGNSYLNYFKAVLTLNTIVKKCVYEKQEREIERDERE